MKRHLHLIGLIALFGGGSFAHEASLSEEDIAALVGLGRDHHFCSAEGIFLPIATEETGLLFVAAARLCLKI